MTLKWEAREYEFNFGERTAAVGNTTFQDLTFNQFTSIVTSEILGSSLNNNVQYNPYQS
jgi:hypothetical protein